MATKQPTVWKKRILVPFWIIRIGLMLFIIAAYAWAINVLRQDPEYTAPAIGVVVIFMLLIIAVLLMDILAILLFLRDGLNPKTFLILNCVQTAFWAAVLILDIVSVARGESGVGLGFTIFVLFTFVALLIYAIIGYRRQRAQARLGHYAPAHNPAAPVAHGAHPPAYMNAAPYQQNTAYYPPTGGISQDQFHMQNTHGAAGDYYNTQPAKPAHYV
ncbi:hypothetical protein K491DRAFT_610012 [Lophiostoma macrostomum CBS 122681]|uniref:MARVEL domain-containing protein n=1 Tax=Lophiostoma macrostomum CBS 122681 TaxID=1314788 RepID=A0A6A6SS78_9PLEO|nr:hypothetical protein K491DRAFT_610012 [Lophiostoma macrostomum CBS 122681]